MDRGLRGRRGDKSGAGGSRRSPGKDRPEYRRLAIDVAIQAGLGRFFGAKFRAGVLYRIYEQTGDRDRARRSREQLIAKREQLGPSLPIMPKAVYVRRHHGG